jgi:hypothetical protein
MKLKNVSPYGDHVVASNLNNVNFASSFLNCKNEAQNQTSYVVFSTRCCNCPQKKIPHIVHLTN